MIMKMSNAEIIMHVNKINELQEREKSDNCNIFGGKIKIAYSLIKNKRAMVSALEPYNEALKKVMEECGVENQATEDGKMAIEIKEGLEKKFFESVAELQAFTVDVDISKITIDDLDGSLLNLSEIESMSFMIE